MRPGRWFYRLGGILPEPQVPRPLVPAKQVTRSLLRAMASEIFGTAALFWVLIPVGLAGGALLLKLLKD
jgi:cytochrome b6-f complex subunit 7